MRKIKTILGIVFSLAIVTTMNTTVFAANDSGIPERRGVYIREWSLIIRILIILINY